MIMRNGYVSLSPPPNKKQGGKRQCNQTVAGCDGLAEGVLELWVIRLLLVA